MRLSCPQCHTEYEVPDAALAGRARTLRCADCGATFRAPELPPLASAAEIAPEAVVAATGCEVTPAEIDHAMMETALPDVVAEAPFPEPEADRPAVPPLPRTAQQRWPAPKPAAPKRSPALGISVLLVALAIAAVVAEHKAIGHVWPPSLRLFDALGLR